MATCASLPAEVLELILALLPRHARLVVASLVCKRWRTSVLRTITTVTWGRQQSISPERYMLQLLPNLTGIKLTDGAVIERRLRSIDALSAPLNFAPLAQMLLASSDTLESLAMELDPDNTSGWYSNADDMTFPALTHLRLRWAPVGPLPPLLTVNASRLTSLYIRGSTGTSSINMQFLELPLRCLRRLSLSRQIAIHHENLATLLRHAPQLCELSVAGIDRLTRVPLSLLTCLVCLNDTQLRESHDNVLQFADRLPRATFANFHCTLGGLTSLTPLTLGRICRLGLSVMRPPHPEARVWHALMHATRLVRLRLHSFALLATQPPPPPFLLPSLRKLELSLYVVTSTATDFPRMLNALVSIAPNLRSLIYDLHDLIEGDFHYINRALRDAGVAVVAKGIRSPPPSDEEIDEAMKEEGACKLAAVRAAWADTEDSDDSDDYSDSDTDTL